MENLTRSEIDCINEVMEFCGLDENEKKTVMSQCNAKAREWGAAFNAYTWAHQYCAPFNRKRREKEEQAAENTEARLS